MEQPNLDYINDIARGDHDVKESLISVVKSEFPEEKELYFNSLEKKDFKDIKEIVHRIKHKFSILGLVKSYENANAFEKSLRDQSLNKQQQQDFEQMLLVISTYLETI